MKQLSLVPVKLKRYLTDHKLIVGTVAIILLAVALGIWFFGWGWTGFLQYTTHTITTPSGTTEVHAGKTLWDWLELLIILFMTLTGTR